MRLLAQQQRQVATLEEVARRAVRNGTPTMQAVTEVRRITDDLVLLGLVAGRARAGGARFRSSNRSGRGWPSCWSRLAPTETSTQ